MSSQFPWSLSVEEFFLQNRWQGHSLDHQPPVELSAWQCLSVGDFFGQSPWQGQRSPRQNRSQRSLSLPSIVAEFFDIDWHGKPSIAALPKTVSAAPATSQELKLTDLSNLF